MPPIVNGPGLLLPPEPEPEVEPDPEELEPEPEPVLEPLPEFELGLEVEVKLGQSAYCDLHVLLPQPTAMTDEANKIPIK